MKLFCNCKEEKQQILKTFEDTILAVMTSIEKTNNKFYEMATKIEVEHFKQLEKQSDKQSKLFDKNVDKFLKLLEEGQRKVKELEFEKISRIESGESNSIEKDEEREDPLADLTPAQFANIKSVRFEGEEEIFPVSVE